ncbi:MAG: hypothetical protein R3266_01615, partial [Gemmatimonadota bacterium]|nr:hypothetical protein [Gemmatimonadota bacterium]
MSRPGQKPREQADGSVARLLAPWRWRPIWQGLSLLVLMIAAGVYGMVLSARERAVQATLTGTVDGLRLLAVERDVSIAAHDLLAALAMDMYEGGRAVEVALKREALRTAALEAGRSLAAQPPAERWHLVHRGMMEA